MSKNVSSACRNVRAFRVLVLKGDGDIGQAYGAFDLFEIPPRQLAGEC
jgi:hypothetical protein